MESILVWIEMYAPPWARIVLYMLGGLVCLGQVYIAMSPTEDDDKWLQRMEKKAVIGHILRFFKAFSPVQRKEKKS